MLGGSKQRSVPVLVCGLNVRAQGQQQPGHVGVAIDCGAEQRRAAATCSRPDAGGMLNKDLDNMIPSRVRCKVKGSLRTPSGNHAVVRARLKQCFNRPAIPTGRCLEQRRFAARCCGRRCLSIAHDRLFVCLFREGTRANSNFA